MMIHVRIPKSKKRKPNAAQRQLNTEWQEILKKYEPKKAINREVVAWTPTKSYIRETPRLPSLNTGGGSATKAETNVYTGDKMIGIATLHKSNAVPVFNSMEAVEISKMRR